MNITQKMIKRITLLGLFLLQALGVCACAGPLASGSTSWKEEVLLHDGRVIIVDRHFNRGGYPTVDARERALLDETLTFALPGTNTKISWTTEFRNDVPQRNSLGPLLLDIVNGIPYLATSPAGCIAYNKWGRPNPPYVLFKYVEGAWHQIPLKEFSPELAQSNLMNMPASSQLKPYYTVEDSKTKRQDGNVIAYAKTILREAYPGAGGRCPDFSSQRYRSPKAPIPLKPVTDE